MGFTVAPQLNYRGPYASPFYLPYEAELQSLGESKMPFAFVLYDGTIGAQQTDRGQYSTPEECWLTDVIASSHLIAEGPLSGTAGQFTVELFDAGRQQLLQSSSINSLNNTGSAQLAFYLKHPYRMPTNAQMVSKVINLAPNQNTIQVVGWGVRD